MLERIYITRHGHRSNYSAAFLSSPTGVRADPALAAHGIAQTKALTSHILSLPNKPQKIYSSPYYRCVQTIEPLAKALKVPIYLDEGIAEWYGTLHDANSPDHPTPLNVSEWPRFFPDVEFRMGESGIIGDRRGETMREIHDRVEKAMEKIIKVNDDAGFTTVIFCVHAATHICIGRALTGDPEMEVRTGTASLSEYVRDPVDAGRWKCLRNGDTSFLPGGEERNWWFDGDIPGDDPEVMAVFAKKEAEEPKSRM